MKQHKLKLFLSGGNYKIIQNHPAHLPNICVAMLVLMGLPEHVWTCLNTGKQYATRIHPLVMAQTRRQKDVKKSKNLKKIKKSMDFNC